MWNGRLVNFLKSKNQQLSSYQLKQFPFTFYLFVFLEKSLVLLCLIQLFVLCIVLIRKNDQNEANKPCELK